MFKHFAALAEKIGSASKHGQPWATRATGAEKPQNSAGSKERASVAQAPEMGNWGATEGQPPEPVENRHLSDTVAQVAQVAHGNDQSAHEICATLWDEEDWRAFFEERGAILQYDGGLDRAEAERQAFETTIIHWMNTHPPESLDPDTCAACGHPIGEIGKDAIPVLTGGGEHVWLHHRCWLGWRRHRRNEAAQALAELGIGLPSRSAGYRP